MGPGRPARRPQPEPAPPRPAPPSAPGPRAPEVSSQTSRTSGACLATNALLVQPANVTGLTPHFPLPRLTNSSGGDSWSLEVGYETNLEGRG